MKTRLFLSAALIINAVSTALLAAPDAKPSITGDYLEVRSCDVYTGPCFANAEMGLTGKEGILVWSVREGSWRGTELNGLSVIAVVRTDGTLGDQYYQPRSGKAVLVVDEKANSIQRAALADMAQALSGKLIKEVIQVKSSKMDVAIGTCAKAGCSKVNAGDLVEISTRCLGGKDHLCGNEDAYYPPLTKVNGAYPAFTEVAAYTGNGLNATWELVGTRSAYLGSFTN